MPLSKAKMRERKRLDRANVKPMSNLSPIIVSNLDNTVKPNEAVKPSVVDRLPSRTCSFRLKAVPKPR